jgi:heme exporter protein C
MALIDLANPTRFMAFVDAVLPWLVAATLAAFALGLWGTWLAPDDYQQGATVKILFIHVPNAWLSMFVWATMSVAGLGTLVWRHPLADVAAKCATPLGAAFTFVTLVTGSLWGQPEWGTYWVWDARLTSELILFIMYLAMIALWRTVDDPGLAGRAAAIFALVGAINLPIIKFSVDCWNTLHQGASVLRFSRSSTSLVCRLFGADHPFPVPGQTIEILDGFKTFVPELPLEKPTIDLTMLVPLLTMALAFTLLFFTLHLAAMRNEILRRRVRSLMLIQAERAR